MEAAHGDVTTPAASAAPPPSTTNQCALLRLPAELRNRIYRYTLLTEKERDKVIIYRETIAQTIAQPGLLRTCRQIREEAKLIYYLENRFQVHAEKFDCSLVKFFFKQVEGHWSNYDELAPNKNMRLRVTFSSGWGPLGGKQGLANVMAWLKAYYADEVPALQCQSCDGNEICCAATGMCRVLSELSYLPWNDQMKIVRIVKETSEKQADSRWTWGDDADNEDSAEDQGSAESEDRAEDEE